MADEAAALSVGACNALIDNLLVADSPDGVSLEMCAKSTSYRGPGQAAQRNDDLMRAQVLTATVAMNFSSPSALLLAVPLRLQSP